MMECIQLNGIFVSIALCVLLTVLDVSILGIVFVLASVVTCTHNGHGTRLGEVSGVKKPR